MAKHNLSSQDVRNKLLDLRDSLVQNLEFIQECIDADYRKLRAYYERFGDLQYRAPLSHDVNGKVTGYGTPTEIVIEPLAGKYRATINSLLQSIRLIESDILPEDNPEGSTAASNTNPEQLTQKRASLRNQFKAQADSGEQPNSDTSVENSNIELPIPKIEEPKVKPKPWREKKQQTLVPVKPTMETQKGDDSQKPMTNPAPMDSDSEALRAGLNSLKGSAMRRLRDKYEKKK